MKISEIFVVVRLTFAFCFAFLITDVVFVQPQTTILIKASPRRNTYVRTFLTTAITQLPASTSPEAGHSLVLSLVRARAMARVRADHANTLQEIICFDQYSSRADCIFLVKTTN